MYNPQLFEILMREREREVMKVLGRGGYHEHRRHGNPGVLKKIARREREREILKGMGRGDYYAHRRRRGSGLPKKIVRWFLVGFSRFKTIAGSGQSRQHATDVRGR